MKRIILAPDSFKGTLSAREVCRVEARAIRRLCPGAEVVELPMADGGGGPGGRLLPPDRRHTDDGSGVGPLGVHGRGVLRPAA